MNTRNRTPSKYVYYGLHLYFSGLSLRKTSERLSYCSKRNHVTIWNWIQKYQPKIIKTKQRRICEFIVVDETLLKVGSEYTGLWVVIDAKSKEILSLSISKERNTLVAERFIYGLVQAYGRYPISTDGDTWYPMRFSLLKLNHHIHSPFEKSLVERKVQYIKDRTKECLDDYFLSRVKNCKLKHVRNWLNMFVDYNNRELKMVK